MTLAASDGMSTRTMGEVTENVLHRKTGPVEATSELVRRRQASALALIGFTLALGVVLFSVYGVAALAIYLPALPFAFMLVWESTTALRFDERSEESRHVSIAGERRDELSISVAQRDVAGDGDP